MDLLPSAPLTLNWTITNRCTFACSHCYSRLDTNEELPFGVLSGALEKVSRWGVLSVNFGGGEPLLREEIFAIAADATSLGMRVSMNSNGYLVTAEVSKRLREAGFRSVGISIDSHLQEVHDGFRGVEGSHGRAVAALRLLADAGIRTSVSSVICRINHEHINELISFALEHNVSHLNFHNFKCSGFGYANRDNLDLTPQEWRNFYLSALKLRGIAREKGLTVSLDDPIISLLGGEGESNAFVRGSICGKLSLNIKANGDITPCGFIPLVIGNVITDDLQEMWDSSAVLAKMRNKVPTGKCSSCREYADCLGGCSARALALTGDFNSPDPHCWK